MTEDAQYAAALAALDRALEDAGLDTGLYTTEGMERLTRLIRLGLMHEEALAKSNALLEELRREGRLT